MKLVKPGDRFATMTLAEVEDRAIAYALPAHMMVLMLQEAKKRDGWELRADVLDKLDKSCGVPLADFDTFTISRIAKRIDDHAVSLLHDLSPDDPVDGIHICAMFAMTLLDQGLYDDAHAIIITTSLLLLDDIKNGDGNWPFKERFLRRKSMDVLHRARLRGLYLKQMATTLFEKDRAI